MSSRLIYALLIYFSLTASPAVFAQLEQNIHLRNLVNRLGARRIANADELRALGLESAYSLLDRGHAEFAGIQLRSLEDEFRGVQLFALDRVFLISADGRSGAVNFTGSRVVVLNTLAFASYSHQLQGMVLFHELAAAIGYRDDHYALTTAFYAAQLGFNRSVFDPDVQAYLRNLTRVRRNSTMQPDPRLVSGGITGIGGGGDAFAIEVKLKLLMAALAIKDRAPAPVRYGSAFELVKSVFELSVEAEVALPVSAPIFSHRDTGDGFSQRVLTFPRLVWEHASPPERDRFVRGWLLALRPSPRVRP